MVAAAAAGGDGDPRAARRGRLSSSTCSHESRAHRARRRNASGPRDCLARSRAPLPPCGVGAQFTARARFRCTRAAHPAAAKRRSRRCARADALAHLRAYTRSTVNALAAVGERPARRRRVGARKRELRAMISSRGALRVAASPAATKATRSPARCSDDAARALRRGRAACSQRTQRALGLPTARGRCSAQWPRATHVRHRRRAPPSRAPAATAAVAVSSASCVRQRRRRRRRWRRRTSEVPRLPPPPSNWSRSPAKVREPKCARAPLPLRCRNCAAPSLPHRRRGSRRGPHAPRRRRRRRALDWRRECSGGAARAHARALSRSSRTCAAAACACARARASATRPTRRCTAEIGKQRRARTRIAYSSPSRREAHRARWPRANSRAPAGECAAAVIDRSPPKARAPSVGDAAAHSSRRLDCDESGGVQRTSGGRRELARCETTR